MALIGTVSGSNGTSSTAITGTLVIANTTTNFPGIPIDAALFVSGTIGGDSKSVFGGDVVISGTLSPADLVMTGTAVIEANSSAAGLRVTQIGSGEAIRVEDSANPDASPFVVTALGRVGIGTGSPTAALAVTGAVETIPTFVARASDSAVDTFVVTSSAAAGFTAGMVRIDQGNLTNKYAMSITNIGAGASGIYMATSAGAGALEIRNFNATPLIKTSNKNLAFETDNVALDSSGVSFSFTETQKQTIQNTKTFLIRGNTTGFKSGSYFEIQKSGSIAIFEVQGDPSGSIVYMSGSALITGSLTTRGDVSITSATSKLNFGPSSSLQILHNDVNGSISNSKGLISISNNTVNSRVDIVSSGSLASSMFRVRRLTGPVGSQTQTDLLEVRNDGTILIGSASTTAVGLGSTTISNDLFLSTGIVSVSTDSTPIQLVSSGNVTIKLDANNNAPGHYFAVVNNNGINQFTSKEDGDAEISGSLVVSGSSLSTMTTTTFNLLNTTLTGTLNIGGATQRMNFGGVASTGSFAGELLSDGNFSVGLVSERLFNTSSAGGTMNFSVGPRTIFYVNNPTSDITASFTGVPTTDLRVITPTVILSQSGTPRNIAEVRIENVVQPIKWAGGSSPTVTANRQEVFGFSLIRSGSIWTVLGQMTSYG
jgi:hypothetical protein